MNNDISLQPSTAGVLKRIQKICQEHRGIILCSLVLTVLIFAPWFAFPVVTKSTYQGININHFGSDAHYYLSRAKEVLDGHRLGDPFLREGKNQPDPTLSYPDYLLLAPVKLLGLAPRVNIVSFYTSYNALAVFFILFLIYFFVLQLSGKKLLSVATALFVVGGYSIVYYKTLFYDDFNIYARVLYPFVSSLLLFIYLNVLVKSYRTGTRGYKIAAALAFGLMFYIYFYLWSFVVVLNGCLGLIFLFKKDFPAAKTIGFISGVGLLLGAYNLIRIAGSLGSEWGDQTAYFMLMSRTHQPIFSKIGFVTLILVGLYWYKNRTDKNLPFFLAISASTWIVFNQQIITGRVLQLGHYYWYFVVPLSIVSNFYMFWMLLPHEPARQWLFGLLVPLVFINTAGGQYKSFFTILESKNHEQNFRPIFDYLNRESTPGVVLAPQANAYLFTIYTFHDLFWHSVAPIYRAPPARWEEALFVYLYLNKESRNNFSNYIRKIMTPPTVQSRYDPYDRILYENIEGFRSGYDYYDYQRKIGQSDSALARQREKLLVELERVYHSEINTEEDFVRLLQTRGVNFLVWDRSENPGWDLSPWQPWLTEVVASGPVRLYRVQF